jgi:hypothetical protein
MDGCSCDTFRPRNGISTPKTKSKMSVMPYLGISPILGHSLTVKLKGLAIHRNIGIKKTQSVGWKCNQNRVNHPMVLVNCYALFSLCYPAWCFINVDRCRLTQSLLRCLEVFMPILLLCILNTQVLQSLCQSDYTPFTLRPEGVQLKEQCQADSIHQCPPCTSMQGFRSLFNPRSMSLPVS